MYILLFIAIVIQLIFDAIILKYVIELDKENDRFDAKIKYIITKSILKENDHYTL